MSRDTPKPTPTPFEQALIQLMRDDAKVFQQHHDRQLMLAYEFDCAEKAKHFVAYGEDVQHMIPQDQQYGANNGTRSQMKIKGR